MHVEFTQPVTITEHPVHRTSSIYTITGIPTFHPHRSALYCCSRSSGAPECAVREAADEVPEIWRYAVALQLCFTGHPVGGPSMRTSNRLRELQSQMLL